VSARRACPSCPANARPITLGSSLLADLRVLDDEDHGQGQRGDQSLKDRLPPAREPPAKLITIHAKSATSTISAMSGRDVHRSTR
jgi:hypothetical protein